MLCVSICVSFLPSLLNSPDIRVEYLSPAPSWEGKLCSERDRSSRAPTPRSSADTDDDPAQHKVGKITHFLYIYSDYLFAKCQTQSLTFVMTFSTAPNADFLINYYFSHSREILHQRSMFVNFGRTISVQHCSSKVITSRPEDMTCLPLIFPNDILLRKMLIKVLDFFEL